MPIKSNAIIRAAQVDPEGNPFEIRIFKRPDGAYTRGFFKDDDVPDTDPTAELQRVRQSDAELLIKLLTGQDLDG